MLLDLLFINALVVILIDLLDIPTTFVFKPIWKIFTKIPYTGWGFKPLSCSLCTSFWLSVLYIIVTHQFTLLNILIVLLFAYFNFIISDVIIIVKECIHKINEIITKKLYE